MVEHLKVRVYLLGGGVSMAALTVEHLKVLMVEPPKGSWSWVAQGRLAQESDSASCNYSVASCSQQTEYSGEIVCSWYHFGGPLCIVRARGRRSWPSLLFLPLFACGFCYVINATFHGFREAGFRAWAGWYRTLKASPSRAWSISGCLLLRFMLFGGKGTQGPGGRFPVIREGLSRTKLDMSVV